MPIVWDTSRQGLALAVRAVLIANVNSRIDDQNDLLTTKFGGTAYQLPTVPTGNIRLRQRIARPMPQHLPFIAVKYIDRNISDLATSADYAEGDSSHDQDIHYWLTGVRKDDAAGLDSEETLCLATGDFVQAVVNTLRRADDAGAGIYGKAEGSMQAVSLLSDRIEDSYTSKDGTMYTVHGSMTFNYKQRVTYG